MPEFRLHGIVTALATPFRPDERIDYSAWETNLDRQIAAGVDGLLAAGGQGEFFALESEERLVALRFCRQHVDGRVPLWGNVGANTTRQSVELAVHAEAEGVDVLAAAPPCYIQPCEEELAEHYVELCRAVRAQVVACNIPQRTGVDISPAAVAAIAARAPNFAGVQDSSGRLERVAEYRAAAARPLAILTGDDESMLRAFELGASGAASAAANVVPRLFADLYRAFREGRQEEAARLQELAVPLCRLLASYTPPAMLKAAMELAGSPAGVCRKPAGAVPEEARLSLAAAVDALRHAGYVQASGAALHA